MVENDIMKMLESLEKRVSRLENIVSILSKSTYKEKKKNVSATKYKGLTGGINFLIEHDFLKKLVTVDEIQTALKREGYVYPRKSVDKILRIDFVLKKKILIRDKEDGVWKYVIRK